MTKNRLGIVYIIIKTLLTLIVLALIGLLVYSTVYIYKDQNYCPKTGKKIGSTVWDSVNIVILLTGLFGVWKENFLTSLMVAISFSISLFTGVAVCVSKHVVIMHIFTCILMIIYCWMLYQVGNTPSNFRQWLSSR